MMNPDRINQAAGSSSRPLRTIFCGTPDFAVPTLERMAASPYRPVLVVTQPDRKRGRGQKVAPSPVKEVALREGIPVYQPERFNTEETLARLSDTGANLAIVVAYSAKIGKRALCLLPEGWLNLHPSLLPAYRGAAPMQWALLEGATETGISTFFLNEEWDAGPICFQERTPILPEDDYGALADRCARQGADLVLRSLEAIEKGEAPTVPQDERTATFAPLLNPEDCLLDWQWSAAKIHCRVRGLSPRPGAKTSFEGKEVRIMRSQIAEDQSAVAPPGTVVAVSREGFLVATGEGVLVPMLLKPENKDVMTGRDFLNGFRIVPGKRFENLARTV